MSTCPTLPRPCFPIPRLLYTVLSCHALALFTPSSLSGYLSRLCDCLPPPSSSRFPPPSCQEFQQRFRARKRPRPFAHPTLSASPHNAHLSHTKVEDSLPAVSFCARILQNINWDLRVRLSATKCHGLPARLLVLTFPKRLRSPQIAGLQCTRHAERSLHQIIFDRRHGLPFLLLELVPPPCLSRISSRSIVWNRARR